MPARDYYPPTARSPDPDDGLAALAALMHSLGWQRIATADVPLEERGRDRCPWYGRPLSDQATNQEHPDARS